MEGVRTCAREGPLASEKEEGNLRMDVWALSRNKGHLSLETVHLTSVFRDAMLILILFHGRSFQPVIFAGLVSGILKMSINTLVRLCMGYSHCNETFQAG